MEAQTLREQVNAFNAAEQQVQVKLITLPVGDYARQVQAAAAHGGLPDILDFDGPNLYNYAWSGKLKPIDSCVSQSLREDLLSSIIQQGTYANRLRAWPVASTTVCPFSTPRSAPCLACPYTGRSSESMSRKTH